MASNEQTVTLLRANKRAQVEALNSLGFKLSETERASKFPELVQWASGLLDVCVAANRISDNRKFFFTIEEWQSLSAHEQGLFLIRGFRIRARGLSFVIAPDNITSKKWGSNKIPTDSWSYSSKKDLYSYDECHVETALICDYFSGVIADGVEGAPAAEACLSYKAFTFERDGLADTTTWALPTVAQMSVCIEHKQEINEAIMKALSADSCFVDENYWTCNNYSVSEAYYASFLNCQRYPSPKSNAFKVRPVSKE